MSQKYCVLTLSAYLNTHDLALVPMIICSDYRALYVMQIRCMSLDVPFVRFAFCWSISVSISFKQTLFVQI